MSKTLAAEVEEIDDGITDAWNDWTPRKSRVLARRVRVRTSTGYVYLEESEKSDPRIVHFYMNANAPHANGYQESQLDLNLKTTQLDEIIDALTLARDAAIANWMIEPVR